MRRDVLDAVKAARTGKAAAEERLRQTAVEAVRAGAKVAHVARAADVTRATIYRWMNEAVATPARISKEG